MLNQPATDNCIEQDQDSQSLHSEMAEKTVLGGLMRQDGTLDVLAVLLTADDFINPVNKLIFNHILSVIKNSKIPGLIAVAESLEIAGELHQIGGLNYLNSLLEDLPDDRNIQNCAIILRERLVSRTASIDRIDEEMLILAAQLRQSCRESVRRKRLENLSSEITARVMTDHSVTSSQLINEAVADLLKLLVAS